MEAIDSYSELNNEQRRIMGLILGQPMTAGQNPMLQAYTQETYLSERKQQESQGATLAGANGVKAGTKNTPAQLFGMGPAAK